MIYLPSNVFPNNGNTIDCSIANQFSLIFSGTKCVAYELRIIDNSSYEEIYTSDKVDLTSPIYNGETLSIVVPDDSGMINGNDYQWSIRLYGDLSDQFIISGTVQEDTSSENIKLRIQPSIKVGHDVQINGERRRIVSYNYETGETVLDSAFTNAITKGQQYQIYSSFGDSSSFYFKARTTPTLLINTFPNPLDARKYTFGGTYYQEQNVPIKYCIWNLYSEKDGSLIETTDRVYSGKLQYFFDGIVIDERYMIELIVENQDGVIITTPKQKFTAVYEQPDIKVKPVAEVEHRQGRVHVQWEKDRFSEGKPSDDCEYEFIEDFPFDGTNSVWIKKGSIVYDEISNRRLEIDDDYFTVFMNVSFEDDKTGKIISLSNDDGDEYYIEIFGCNFYSVKNGIRTFIKHIYYVNEWILSTEPAQYDTGYVWDDDQTWFDNIDGVPQIWREPLTPLLSKQFKITMLKDIAMVEEVHPS